MDDTDQLLDIDHNALFRALQTKFHKVWQQAQENCWIVCIPHPSIANSIRLTKDVVQRHVLRPSPIIKGQFLTFGSKPQKFEFHGKTLQNIGTGEALTIVYEEAFYNENFEPFKVYCISTAIGPFQNLKDSDDREDFQLKRLSSGREYIDWLKQNIDSEKMKQCQQLVNAFNIQYLTAKGYIYFLREKINDLWNEVRMKFQGSYSSRRTSLQSTSDVTQFWEEAAECFVLTPSYLKLKEVYQHEKEEHNHVLQECIRAFADEPEKLDVSTEFSNLDLSQAVSSLKGLPDRQSRIDKDACLQEVLDLIAAAVEMNNVTHGQRLSLTSDDLVPLLAKVVLLSQERHLFSELAYLQDLRLAEHTETCQANFNLVTFEAALVSALQSYSLAIPSSAVNDPDTHHINAVHDKQPSEQEFRDEFCSRWDVVTNTTGIHYTRDDSQESSGTTVEEHPPRTACLKETHDELPKHIDKGSEPDDNKSHDIVLPEIKSSVTTTDGKAPKIGRLLSSFSEFGF